MNSVYRKLLDKFGTEKEIMEAILTNHPLIYYLLSRLAVVECESYKQLERRDSRTAADRTLSECLVIFRRQIKFGKADILIKGDSIMVGKNRTGLAEFLNELIQLVFETSPLNPMHEFAADYQHKLIKGQGYQSLYQLKNLVEQTLHTSGCTRQEDKEDIFNESLLVLWKKLQQGEAGIYFTNNMKSIDHCRIYNRTLYQQSKIGTFLAGISRNIFMNLTRNPEYVASRNYSCELDPETLNESAEPDPDNLVLLMFLFYRACIESRKLRSVISILQYDCNLEDKEVQRVLALNNTRIHSSRLRAHFYEWHSRHMTDIPSFLDASSSYFAQRDEKKEMINRKIRAIHLYERTSHTKMDLEMFREEFGSDTDFSRYYPVFKYMYYFISTGKSSSLAGLADEKSLREMMELFKKDLFSLPSFQTLCLLLFYGSDEPAGIITSLMQSLLTELDEPAQETSELTRHLSEFFSTGTASLSKEIYNANNSLFRTMTEDTPFIKHINTHETAQSSI